jgi:hypothetical protein
LFSELSLAKEFVSSKHIDDVHINLQEAWLILRKALEEKKYEESYEFYKALE